MVTHRGSNCRPACASIFSVVTIETVQPAEALQTVLGMLDRIPKPSNGGGASILVVDDENTHVIQGLALGAAYLLKHLHDRFCGSCCNNCGATASSLTAASGAGKSKKSKKQGAKSKQQLQSGIGDAIEKFLKTIG